MPIRIRSLAAADRDAWCELWNGYQRFYEASITDEVTALTWSRLLESGGAVRGLGAEAEGRLVGIAHYLFHPSSWTRGDYCYLQDLFVAKEARGQGAARALIEAVAQAAEAAGAARTYWLTHETNERAKALYDRIASRTGFIHYRL